MILPKLNFPRRPKRVTLIAAIPCQQGFVIAADSQETIPFFDGLTYIEYRKTVQKIIPKEIGEFSYIVAGAGHADLIDTFIEVLDRELARKPSGNTVADFAEYVEQTLAKFYKKDVALCPSEDKEFQLFIAAVPIQGGDYGVWVQKKVRLIPVIQGELIGHRESLYVNVIRRLCKANMTIEQGVSAAVYALTIAEQTSNSVRGPMSVAIVRPYGIQMENQDYIDTLGKHLKAYEKQTSQLLLACSDTSISVPDLEDAIEAFKQTSLALHRDQIDRWAQSGNPDVFGLMGARKLPNVPITLPLDEKDKLTVEHDRAVIEKVREQKKGDEAWVKEHGTEFLTKAVKCSKCQMEFEAKMPCSGPHAHCLTTVCPHCQELQIIEWDAV
jgi:20S proteasome alpha/beta subunit